MAKPKSEIRVGLVGYRGRGRHLADYWQGVAGARLAAVADMVPEHLDQAREQLGPLEVYPDHQIMLDQANLDIVTIATQAHFRPPIVRDVAASGVRGLYIEKPMANSLHEADEMIAQCRNGGTVLTIGHQRRWREFFRGIRDQIKEGAIGRPTHGFVYWTTGRIGTSGTHKLDAINFMLDSRPVEVAGKFQRGLDLAKVDDNPGLSKSMTEDPGAMGFVTYANGFRLAVDCMNDVLLPNTYIFCGTRGRIEFNEADWEVEYRARDEDTRSHRVGRSTPAPQRSFPALPPGAEGVGEQDGLRELMTCIETGARSTSSGEDGRLALETIIAFHLSADDGMRAVSLPLPQSAQHFKLDLH